jgi:hypothetical protein
MTEQARRTYLPLSVLNRGRRKSMKTLIAVLALLCGLATALVALLVVA